MRGMSCPLCSSMSVKTSPKPEPELHGAWSPSRPTAWASAGRGGRAWLGRAEARPASAGAQLCCWPLATGVTLGETRSALLDTQCSASNPAQRTLQNPSLGLQRSAWSVLPRPSWPPRLVPPPLRVFQAHRHRYALSIIPSSEPLLSAGRPLRLERPSQLLLPWPLRLKCPRSLSPRAPVCSLVAPSILQNNHTSFFVSQNVYSVSPPENVNSSIRGPRRPRSLLFPHHRPWCPAPADTKYSVAK